MCKQATRGGVQGYFVAQGVGRNFKNKEKENEISIKRK